MRKPILAASAALLLAACAPAALRAQQPRIPPPSQQPRRGPAGRPPGHNQEGSCLRKAGISQATMQKRRAIHESTISQIQSVCNDSALSEQQKAAKIREIRQAVQQQMNDLLTPAQLEALKQCQNSHEHQGGGGGHPGHAPAGGQPHGMGPCGQGH